MISVKEVYIHGYIEGIWQTPLYKVTYKEYRRQQSIAVLDKDENRAVFQHS